ncbi:BQ5605_C010g06094 [Microbotryum silenes-dioicae]|uniref:BQ5605_C010g06094 protein n=1 Tax=Microbotryum silenes-dioicae TaxID=796604 RepID=A0A2X0MJR6_9BASI|nr:BQ5605_C010g06094 [Microbotryum silenes-dioicae]
MATFADLLSFVFPSTRFMVDNTAEPEAPPPLTQRGPGEYFPPGLDLISACHDSSLVDRVLSALGRGFDKNGKLDLALPWTIDSAVVWGGYVIDSVEIALGRLYLTAIRGVSMLKAIGHERLSFDVSTENEKHHPLSVASCEYYLFRVPPDDGAPPRSPGPEDDEVSFTPVVVHGYMASDLKTYYDGITNASGVERPGLGAHLLDIRIVNATGELVRLEGARAIAAKVGLTFMGEAARLRCSRWVLSFLIISPFASQIALHATERGDRRFAIILALPYFVVIELGWYNFLRAFAGQAKLADVVASLTLLPLVVVIDGKRHLLISDLCSAVVEPEHSTAKSRSLMGVLLGTLMNDFDDYRVDGHSSEVEQQIRDYVKQLDELTVVNEVQSTDDVSPRDSMLNNSPPAQTSTAPSDEAAASTSIRRPDDTSDSSEDLKAFVNQGNQTVMARHFPKQAIVCDVKELPHSRMVAIPIELEMDTAPALSPQQPPAKKIRLDSDAHRPKLTEALSLAIQELFSPDAFFSKAEGTFSSPLASTLTSRLNLVRRVDRGASSSVWQAKCCITARAVHSSSITSANPSTPTPPPETPPHTSPRSLLDVRSTPDASPTPDLPSAMNGLSSAGIGGRGKLVAKVVRERFTPSIAREYFVYTSIVPLLSVKAQEYFPAFHGLYRSGNEGQAYIFVMKDAGSPITHKQLEADAELKAKVDFALKLIADEGLHHNDEGARNVLLRPDGRICLIDWGEAQVR